MKFYATEKLAFLGNSQHLYAICFQKIKYSIFNKIIQTETHALQLELFLYLEWFTKL